MWYDLQTDFYKNWSTAAKVNVIIALGTNTTQSISSVVKEIALKHLKELLMHSEKLPYL
jgi:hypothetical protein